MRRVVDMIQNVSSGARSRLDTINKRSQKSILSNGKRLTRVFNDKTSLA